MIMVQTPFRMSFFGGGTDMPEYYKKYGGSVLSTTFDKYCYHIIRYLPQFFEYNSKLVYSKIESVNDINDFEHPAVREALKMLKIKDVHITYDADLPARSGLGTSSSFAVGLLNGLHCLKNEAKSKIELAEEAIYLERVLCNEAGGIQDQLAAAVGGFNKYVFSSDGIEVYPINISEERKKELEENLMLFFTGFTRFSAEVIKEQIKNTDNKLIELQEMNRLVSEAEKILVGDYPLKKFGELLDYTWSLKRNLSSSISNLEIDNIYEKAKEAGAIGGKILGAGGGGFLLLYVEKEFQEKVKKTLKDLLYIPFEFENDGTKILYKKGEDYCE